MNFVQTNFIYKTVTVFVLASLLFFGLFGMLRGMEMGNGGSMDDCPFTVGASICNMNLFEHIQSWQNMFRSLPQKPGFLGLLMSLTVFFFVITRFVLRDSEDSFCYSKKYYSAEDNTYPFHGILQELFSQGIIHSKSY